MRRGFTSVEVLTVIFIIGMLVTITSYIYAAALVRSRDTQRLTDLQTIKNSLEQYYTDHRSFPPFDTGGNGTVYAAAWQLDQNVVASTCRQTRAVKDFLAPTYITSLPEDPAKKFSSTARGCEVNVAGQYLYFGLPKATGKIGYYLLARLERPEKINWNPAVGETLVSSGYSLSVPGLNPGNTVESSHNYFVTAGRNN